jgi:WD40 repeat protein
MSYPYTMLGLAPHVVHLERAAAAGLNEIELWRRTENGWKKPSNFRANIFSRATTMSFGPCGATLLVGGGVDKKGEVVYLFDVSGEKRKQIATIEGHKAAVLSVSASSNGKFLASTDESGHVIVSSVGGEKLYEWTFPGPVRCVSFAPDGQHLALGNGDGTVYILRLTTPPRK